MLVRKPETRNPKPKPFPGEQLLDPAAAATAASLTLAPRAGGLKGFLGVFFALNYDWTKKRGVFRGFDRALMRGV